MAGYLTFPANNYMQTIGQAVSVIQYNDMEGCFLAELADGMMQLGNSYQCVKSVNAWICGNDANADGLNGYPNTNYLSVGFGIYIGQNTYGTTIQDYAPYMDNMDIWIDSAAPTEIVSMYPQESNTGLGISGNAHVTMFTPELNQNLFGVQQVAGVYTIGPVGANGTITVYTATGINFYGAGSAGLSWTTNGTVTANTFAGNFLAGRNQTFAGNGSGLTALNAAQLTGVVPAASLPGITTNVSAAGITLHITNGLIMQVSTP